MKLSTILTLVLAFTGILITGSAQAELYKSIGPDGKITYSDTPPPANAKRLPTKVRETSDISSNLPPELAAAVQLNPVTLYTAPDCTACNEGRALLKGYGIPFTEKSVASNDDIEKLKKLNSGDTTLPLLVIRNTKFKGLDSKAWRTGLSSAGYPEVNKLPKDYKYAAAEPAAPVQPKPVEEAPAPSKPAPQPTPSKPTIRF